MGAADAQGSSHSPVEGSGSHLGRMFHVVDSRFVVLVATVIMHVGICPATLLALPISDILMMKVDGT